MANVRIFEETLVISAKNHVFICRAILKPNDFSLLAFKHIDILALLQNQNGAAEEKSNGDGNKGDIKIIDSAFSSSGKLFAIVTSWKKLLVLDTTNWSIHGALHTFPKAATKVLFDIDEKSVFVSQRSGDVYRFLLEKDAEPEKEPLLGHFSMILDMCLTSDGKALITADRDEKIRINELPIGAEIRHFLLGHESYVNSVNVFENFLFSSVYKIIFLCGDSKLIIWDIEKNVQVAISDEISKNPVRKICLLPSKDCIHVIILPQQSNELVVYKFDVKECVLIYEKKLTTKHLDEELPIAEEEYTKFLMDLTIDISTGTIICVGLSGIFTGHLTSPHLIPLFVAKDNSAEDLNAEWFGTELMFHLQSSSDPFPYKELEKHTLPDNLEKYKETRDAKLRKHRADSSDLEEPHKKVHLDPTTAESTEEMAEEIFQHNKPPEDAELDVKELERLGEGHKAGVHIRPLPM